MMRSLYRFLEEDGDELLLGWLWKVPVVFVATVSLLGRWLYVPYGRYGDHRSRIPLPAMVTSVKLPARQAWLIQEIPSLAVPLFLLLNVGGRFVGAVNPNIVLLGMFLLHYVNRTFVYSLTTRGRSTPLFPMLCGMALCAVNGYLQGRYLTNYAHYDTSWFYDPRFLIGHLLFLVGMAINIYSDSLLRSLRSPGETGYKIPYGGLFDYVSCANYFGEALEWTGYAIACWSVIAASFALWASLFLGSRALQHHKFYHDKFEDYPKNRKAFIPFIL